MPAISTTRRSWISPQRPRTWGARSAFTRFPVSAWSACWVCAIARTCSTRPAYDAMRSFSTSCSFPSTRASDSWIGRTRSPTACCRRSRSDDGALLELAELGLGEREEALVVLPERLGGERGEGVAQTGLGPLEQRDLLAGRAALGVEPLLQPGDAAPPGEPGAERADREGDEEERKVHSACVWQDDGGGDTSARRPTNVPTRLRAGQPAPAPPNNPHRFPAPGVRPDTASPTTASYPGPSLSPGARHDRPAPTPTRLGGARRPRRVRREGRGLPPDRRAGRCRPPQGPAGGPPARRACFTSSCASRLAVGCWRWWP